MSGFFPADIPPKPGNQAVAEVLPSDRGIQDLGSDEFDHFFFGRSLGRRSSGPSLFM